MNIKELRESHCHPVRKDDSALDSAAIEALLTVLTGWSLAPSGNRIVKHYGPLSYPKLLSFGYQVGEMAIEQNHHPIIELKYRQISVVWFTAVCDGLTKNDFICAAKTDHLYERV